MIPGWAPANVVQTVLIGCTSRSRGQKIGSKKAVLKNLPVQSYNVTSSSGHPRRLLKLCP